MKTKQRQNNMLTPSRKTFQNPVGKWIVKKTRTEILVCASCRGKYLKTRKNQTVCIRCIYRTAPVQV